MDRNFERSLSLVLKHEGGWADHPKDPGGATMKGVTLATFKRYVKADATKTDLRKITDTQLATTYRRHYWDAALGAKLPDGVDFAVFDFGVNSGPSRAIKFLQGVVGAKQDGRIGPATLAAVAKMDRDDIIQQLCDKRLAWLKSLPTWKTFGKGWSNRIIGVRVEATKMAKNDAPAVIPATSTPIPDAKLAPPPSDPKSPRGRLTKLTLVMVLVIVGVVIAAIALS